MTTIVPVEVPYLHQWSYCVPIEISAHQCNGTPRAMDLRCTKLAWTTSNVNCFLSVVCSMHIQSEGLPIVIPNAFAQAT